MPAWLRAACRPIQTSSTPSNSTGRPLVSKRVNHGSDGVATSMTMWWAWSRGISNGSPTTLGKVVRKPGYDGGGGAAPVFFSGLVFVDSLLTGSGHGIAWL